MSRITIFSFGNLYLKNSFDVKITVRIKTKTFTPYRIARAVLQKAGFYGELVNIPWTYAYYELAERNLVELETGQKVLFDGFQGANAQHLFEMTRKG